MTSGVGDQDDAYISISRYFFVPISPLGAVMPSWDPTRYAAFADERARPFADLMARVATAEPGLVVDLGCGDGARTLEVAARWPGARVLGLDSSAQMLARARELDAAGRVEWVLTDLAGPEAYAVVAGVAAELGLPGPEVVLAAASLQWVPGHLDVGRRWIETVAPGGCFAMQVPGNHDAPSHALMRAVAAEQPRAAELLPLLLSRESVADPAGYVAAWWAPDRQVEAWETTYYHLLDPGGHQVDPVLEWVRGTGLRPVLDVLAGAAEREAFLAPYRAALAQAYPRTPAGVPLAFRRVFCVVHIAPAS